MNPARRAELQEAMDRLSDGDRAAFPAVFEIAWPLLRGFSRSALGSAFDAEDAAQQALLKVFERASEFEAGRDVLPWILAVAMNECRTIRRRGFRRREEPLDGPDPADLRPSPEDQAITMDLEGAVRGALRELSGQDVATIVESLRSDRGASTATFRKRLERARKRLRAAWSARNAIL
jgi:RNA polymerase sigma factor (sigma-70 family)